MPWGRRCDVDSGIVELGGRRRGLVGVYLVRMNFGFGFWGRWRSSSAKEFVRLVRCVYHRRARS